MALALLVAAVAQLPYIPASFPNRTIARMSSNTPDLDFITFPDNPGRVDYAMIGLHGRNANKFAFFPFVRQMGFLHTRWVLPSAPFATPQAPDVRWWFDREARNADEIADSRARIFRLIDAQVADGVAPENIFLVGFSQGAVMSVDAGLRYPLRLGGIVALSGYIAHPDLLALERHAANARVPVFLGHGSGDETISVDTGRDNATVLRGLGYHVDAREYETGHRISSDEVRDIRAFLHRHMYGIPIDDPRQKDDHVVVF